MSRKHPHRAGNQPVTRRYVAGVVRRARDEIISAKRPIHSDSDYATIDVVTGMDDGPVILAVPMDIWAVAQTSHLRIDLPAMGFRIVRDGGRLIPPQIEAELDAFLNEPAVPLERIMRAVG